MTVHFSPLTVLSIGPRFSGNATSITGATLTGQNFIDGATVRLTRAGSDDIAATNVIWVSSTEITCDFDLTGAVSGAWNVVVTNPDAISGQLTNGFFVGTMSGWGWGYNFFGECNVPDGIDFVAICGGYYHSLALRSDGSLVSWGNDGEGEVSNTPAGNDFLAVSSGAYHSLALSSDGTIAAWGSNGDGQCNVPAGNDFVAIAAGYSHSLALRSDGTVAAWGNNGNGQCNVPAGNDFVAIAGGAYHSLALRSDGTIAAWGSNSNGQSNVPAGNDFVAIAGGAYHSLALRSDGSLVSWGYNGNGQVSNTPSGSDFIEIGCGPSAYHSLALRSDGSIAAWGYNANGECNVPAGDDFVLVAAGGNHSLALCRPYTVTASVGGSGLGGSVDPLSQLVGYGRTAQIDIITDARWHMVSLTDNGAPQALTGTYVIPNVREDHEVVVTFAAEIAVTVNGGHGTVDPAYQEAVSGSDAVIDLLPDPGYHVTFISDNGMPMPLSDPYVIPAVDGPHDVLVVYSIGEVNVNAYVTGGHGSVSPAGQSVTYGGIATIDITPESGYMIESVTDNDVPVAGPFTAPYTYTIDPVTEVHNVVVTFAASSYDVNATVFFGGGDVNPAYPERGLRRHRFYRPDPRHRLPRLLHPGQRGVGRGGRSLRHQQRHRGARRRRLLRAGHLHHHGFGGRQRQRERRGRLPVRFHRDVDRHAGRGMELRQLDRGCRRNSGLDRRGLFLHRHRRLGPDGTLHLPLGQLDRAEVLAAPGPVSISAQRFGLRCRG